MLEIWDGGRDVDQYAAPNADDWNRIVQQVKQTQRVVIENNNIYSNIAKEDILIGQPLILKSGIRLAGTHSYPEIIGISIVDCKITTNCIYITQGRLELEDWTNIVNSVKLLPGACYFLSMQEKGKLTTVAPDANGDTVIQVGRAHSEEILSVNLEYPVYLT